MPDEGEKRQRTLVEQFTLQADSFREFAEMPGQAREIVLASTNVNSEDTVLDVACGPGVTTCNLAEIARHATGIDVTPAMIEQAKKRQQTKGLKNVTWLLDSIPPLSFDDETFSLIFTRYSFHHFDDPLAVLKEMVRVCRTGGRVLVIDVFMMSSEQAEEYNRMEKLRDPSHVRALLLDELKELFQECGLDSEQTSFYKQPMALEPLLEGSFPEPGDEEKIREIISNDVGKNRLGIDAHWQGGDIHFAYPIAVLAASKV